MIKKVISSTVSVLIVSVPQFCFAVLVCPFRSLRLALGAKSAPGPRLSGPGPSGFQQQAARSWSGEVSEGLGDLGWFVSVIPISGWLKHHTGPHMPVAVLTWNCLLG